MIHRTARARVTPVCTAIGVSAALVMTAGCGLLRDGKGTASVSRYSFEARLIEREKITDTQAHCVSRYVYAGYHRDAIRVIYDKGFTSLPSPMWSEYAHAMVGCAFHDQLVPRNQLSSTGP